MIKITGGKKIPDTNAITEVWRCDACAYEKEWTLPKVLAKGKLGATGETLCPKCGTLANQTLVALKKHGHNLYIMGNTLGLCGIDGCKQRITRVVRLVSAHLDFRTDAEHRLLCCSHHAFRMTESGAADAASTLPITTTYGVDLFESLNGLDRPIVSIGDD